MGSVDDIVITGAGLCCYVGDGDEAVQRVRRGQSRPFARWAPAVEYGGRCQIIGEYDGDLSDGALGLGKAEARFMGRAPRLALRASRQALQQSGCKARELAVLVGSGTGDVETHCQIRDKLTSTGQMRRISPAVVPRLMASTVAANLSTVLGSTGASCSLSAACAGGAYNMATASLLIQAGAADSVLAGGVEVADIHFFAGFDAMRAYTAVDNDTPERASRPFAADRQGFVFSEGAGVVILERRGAAQRRGATILGVLRGFGLSSDGAGDMVAPAVEGAVLAMRRALDHAGLTAAQIDYINAHATSTPLGDVGEIEALRQVFDGRLVPYSSTKGYTGHTISAAGAIEAIFTLAMLRQGWIAPSVHAEPVDPALADYPPVCRPCARPLELALSNSFGFGGTNATLVLGRA